MDLTEKDVDNEKLRGSQDGHVSLKEQPSPGISKKSLEGIDALSYANILRSRNKFLDALAVYDSVLGKNDENVEALIGKGICLQMQNMRRLAYESIAEAIRLEPENACALTHYGILYKDDGRLVEAVEVTWIFGFVWSMVSIHNAWFWIYVFELTILFVMYIDAEMKS